MSPYKCYFVASGIVLLDQLSKQWIVLSGLPYVLNSGVAWSIPIPNGVAIMISLVILVVLLVHRKEVPVAMIYGGAIGNLIDRLTRGGVIDFISVPLIPTFNVADSAITIGVIIFLYFQFFRKDYTQS